jgi:MFS family permease
MVHRAVNPRPRSTCAARESVHPVSVSGDDGSEAARPAGNAGDEEPRRYPDHLDSRLLKMAGVCVLATLMTILDITVINVAQRTFIDQFHSTEAIVAWTMTGYTLALAAVIPLTGWAADRFGTKRLFLGSVALFTAGSLLCALASNIGEFDRISGDPGAGRRHGDATGVHHFDSRSRPGPTRSAYFVAGHPDGAGPAVGTGVGWLVDRVA